MDIRGRFWLEKEANSYRHWLVRSGTAALISVRTAQRDFFQRAIRCTYSYPIERTPGSWLAILRSSWSRWTEIKNTEMLWYVSWFFKIQFFPYLHAESFVIKFSGMTLQSRNLSFAWKKKHNFSLNLFLSEYFFNESGICAMELILEYFNVS